jgi:hypothetical protein
MRVALARQDLSYAQLADELNALGYAESARSVEGKVQRGTFRFAFFLQAIYAARAAYPVTWAPVMSMDGTWEQRAAALVRAELASQSWLNYAKVSRRLEEVGVVIDAETLATQLEEGTFSATLFFQCATVCRFDGLQLYLDAATINEVARYSASESENT